MIVYDFAQNIQNFNSKMVRLKDMRLCHVSELVTNFNSNMVRLKVWLACVQFSVSAYFNSNMVRLKGRTHKGKDIGRSRFQFQYGSIKSCEVIAGEVVGDKFQFQYGSIKS